MTTGRPTARARGYSLVIVMMTLGLITVSMLSLWAYLETSARSTGETVEKRRTFYVCDGLTRMVARLVASYVDQESGMVSADNARLFIQATAGHNLEAIMPAGYRLERLEIGDLTVDQDVPVPNGPFEGIVGRESTMKIKVNVTKLSRDFACKIDRVVALSEIGLFQFAVFGAVDDFPFAHAHNGVAKAMTVDGHVHANGDLCLSNDATGAVSINGRITASGSIYRDASGCAQGPEGGTDPDVNGRSLSFDSTSASWVPDAEDSFSGALRDKAYGVGKLSLPLSARVQSAQTITGAATPQHGQLRSLIDPPVAGESVAEKRNKLAYAADLRIIDGVWYLRDPANPNAWPGTPIWSDHPGHAVDHVDAAFNNRVAVGARQIAVGQRDIGASVGWSSTPTRYSWYAYDAANQRLVHGNAAPTVLRRPVISYGGLHYDPATGAGDRRWVPAVHTQQSTITPMPDPTAIDHCVPGSAPVTAPGNQREIVIDGTSGAFCGPGNRNESSHLIAATKNVFWDSHARAPADPARPLRLVNFDVGAFQEALADLSSGELGAHFIGRQFNGIIWISSLWPGAWQGFPGGQPENLKATVDVVPWNLCSDDLAGAAFDQAGGSSWTTIARCDDVRAAVTATEAPWTNGVRIINARDINFRTDPAARDNLLNRGLTIASNLPVYVMGDFNKASQPAATAADAAVFTPFWIPTLVAGDVVTFLSNNYTDIHSFREFRVPPTSAALQAVASSSVFQTTYNLAVLSGLPFTTSSASDPINIKAGLRTQERWVATPVNFKIHGSVVFGYTPVYAGAWDGGSSGAGYTEADQADTILQFDYRLGTLATQPPGAVAYTVESVRQWERR